MIRILQRFLSSHLWTWIKVVFLTVLVVTMVQFIATLETSLPVFRAAAAAQGVVATAGFDDVMGWGRFSVVILALLAVCWIFDALSQIVTAREYRKVNQIILRFASGEDDLRVPPGRSREVNDLGNAFNAMADTITASMSRMRETDALRRELIANVAHDLGGPITAIQGFIETILLKGESLSGGKRAEYLATALSNTKALGHLVSELFDLSKLDSNIIVPKMQPFSISSLMNDVASRFLAMARDRGVRLTIEENGLVPLVVGDVALIERVATNLIENALKFTPAGGDVSVEFGNEGNGVTAFVRDTGIGIPSEEISRVTERFYRVAKDRSRAFGGAGLGLAIVDKILQLHGSVLRLESVVGKGTVVSFSLRRHKAE